VGKLYPALDHVPIVSYAAINIAPDLATKVDIMVANELAFVAHAEAAGLAVGATVPIILTSPADGREARLAPRAIWRSGEHLGVAAAAE
jgi:phosphate butyryltransferase